MKISELDYSKLSEDEMYSIVTSGIIDLEGVEPTDKTLSDVIVVLGCSPRPLKARIKKMMALQKSGYSKRVLFSGGKGWQSLVKKDPNKRKVLLEDIRQAVSADLLGDNPSQIELDLYERFNEGMKKIMGPNYKTKTYQERIDDEKMELTEEEYMQLIMLTNGGLRTAKMYNEPFSTNTKENMLYTGKVFKKIEEEKKEPIERVMIVTSSFHCRRAYLTFKKNFPNIDFIVVPSTEDLKEYGLDYSIGMIQNEKYRNYIKGEAKKIIDYSKKGDILDVQLSDLVGEEESKRIEQSQKQKITTDDAR